MLAIASLDAMRSSGSKTSAPATTATEIFPPAPAPSTTAPTTTAAPPPAPVTLTDGSARIREHVTRFRVICVGGNGRFARAMPGELGPADLEDIAVWNRDAARAAAQVLAELRDVPPPRQSDRPSINEFFAAMEREIAALRQVAAAASAGQSARIQRLTEKRVKMTHRKDQLGDSLISRWRLSPVSALRMCPLDLPA
jgi:hypothetical protein